MALNPSNSSNLEQLALKGFSLLHNLHNDIESETNCQISMPIETVPRTQQKSDPHRIMCQSRALLTDTKFTAEIGQTSAWLYQVPPNIGYTLGAGRVALSKVSRSKRKEKKIAKGFDYGLYHKTTCWWRDMQFRQWDQFHKVISQREAPTSKLNQWRTYSLPTKHTK